jgi:hypothetical protein
MSIVADETVLERYGKELNDFCTINEFTVKEKQLQLPAFKHLFVGRLIRHKIYASKLKTQKEKLRSELAAAAAKAAPVVLDFSKVEKAMESNEKIVEINNQIYYNTLIIEYLEKVEKVLSSITYDIKNIVEIMKLETT